MDTSPSLISVADADDKGGMPFMKVSVSRWLERVLSKPEYSDKAYRGAWTMLEAHRKLNLLEWEVSIPEACLLKMSMELEAEDSI